MAIPTDIKISFAHYGNENMASYRYRAKIPAKELGATINDPEADVIIFAKPIDQDVPHVIRTQRKGKKVIADFCDIHFHLPHYEIIMRSADAVTCPTEWFATFLREKYGVTVNVVPDPYEFDEAEPHLDKGTEVMWFGQSANIDSLNRILRHLDGCNLRVVTNMEGAIPWSIQNVLNVMAMSDIVVMPETAPYKSANRTIESIRRGCFVVAEPHPAINDFPGIWVGSIRKGIKWAQQNPKEANYRTRVAQDYVRSRYSPAIQANAWRIAIEKALSSSTSEVATFTGTNG